MPIATRSTFTAITFTPKSQEDEPETDRTTFSITPLDGLQHMEVLNCTMTTDSGIVKLDTKGIEMADPITIETKVDFELLRKQKKALLIITDTADCSGVDVSVLEGPINMIDSIQDRAVDETGISEETVFGPSKGVVRVTADEKHLDSLFTASPAPVLNTIINKKA